MPAANPIPMAINIYTASCGSSSEVRKRTAATIPARLKASARLPLTRKTTSAMAMGTISRVCAKAWLYFLRVRVQRYTQVIGSVTAKASIKATKTGMVWAGSMSRARPSWILPRVGEALISKSMDLLMAPRFCSWST